MRWPPGPTSPVISASLKALFQSATLLEQSKPIDAKDTSSWFQSRLKECLRELTPTTRGLWCSMASCDVNAAMSFSKNKIAVGFTLEQIEHHDHLWEDPRNREVNLGDLVPKFIASASAVAVFRYTADYWNDSFFCWESMDDYTRAYLTSYVIWTPERPYNPLELLGSIA